MEQTRLFVYFPKSITGYEVTGDAILTFYEVFMEKPDTYLIEFAYSEFQNGMHLFVYEYDKSQKKRKSIFEAFRKEVVLVSAYKYLDSLIVCKRFLTGINFFSISILTFPLEIPILGK